MGLLSGVSDAYDEGKYLSLEQLICRIEGSTSIAKRSGYMKALREISKKSSDDELIDIYLRRHLKTEIKDMIAHILDRRGYDPYDQQSLQDTLTHF